MTFLRLLRRLLLFTLITGASYTAVVLGKYLLYPLKSFRLKWRNICVKIWANLLAKAMGIKIHVIGSIPQPPFFLVSNHLSYLDIVIYFTKLKATFVAKSEVESWHVLGAMAKSVNTLFIKRTSPKDIPRVNSLIQKSLSENDGIIVFPEGTSSNGAEVLPFRSPLLAYPASTELQVYSAAISYKTSQADQPATNSICWYADMTFVDHFLNLLKLKKINATLSFAEKTDKDSDRKLLASKLETRVKSIFISSL